MGLEIIDDARKEPSRLLLAEILTSISRHFPSFDLADPGKIDLADAIAIAATLTSIEGTVCGLAYHHEGIEVIEVTEERFEVPMMHGFEVGLELAEVMIRQAAQRTAGNPSKAN